MKVVNRHCAGLDVHKDEVVACVRRAGRGKSDHEVRRFATVPQFSMPTISASGSTALNRRIQASLSARNTGMGSLR